MAVGEGEKSSVYAWAAVKKPMLHDLRDAADARAEATEAASQATLLRCIVGNPFRAIAFDLDRRTPVLIQITQAAYEDRMLPEGTLDPARLAVLANALEEAGCTDAAILSHLRGPSPHVRGCWALDLILGKC